SPVGEGKPAHQDVAAIGRLERSGIGCTWPRLRNLDAVDRYAGFLQERTPLAIEQQDHRIAAMADLVGQPATVGRYRGAGVSLDIDRDRLIAQPEEYRRQALRSAGWPRRRERDIAELPAAGCGDTL